MSAQCVAAFAATARQSLWHKLTSAILLQGVRPAGLQKVPTLELAEFINVCIGSRESRPRARQLLKHSYFDSIRQEKCAAYKLQADALASGTASGFAVGDPGEFLEDASSQNGNVSRTSSESGMLASSMLPTEHTGAAPLDVSPPSALEGPSMSAHQLTSAPTAPQQAITRPPSLVSASSGDMYSPRSDGQHSTGQISPPLSPVHSSPGDSDGDSAGTAVTAPEVLQAPAPPMTSDSDSHHGVSLEQAATYATVAESLVSMAEVLSDGEHSMFGDTATIVAAGGDRQFKVKGQLHNRADGDEDDKLNLRLRICQPLGAVLLSSAFSVGHTPVMRCLIWHCHAKFFCCSSLWRSGMVRPDIDYVTLQGCTQYSCIFGVGCGSLP